MTSRPEETEDETRPVSRLPDYLPIIARKMATTTYHDHYDEPEITEPLDLCDARGRLNPAAVGWSRHPLTRANLSGHWLRKKRWNFWNWISPDFVLSVTLADIDYVSFCAFFFLDLASGEKVDGIAVARPGRFAMPEHVEETVRFRAGGIEYSNLNRGSELEVSFAGASRGGATVEADFTVRRPEGHESLNIVVPWSSSRFQLNSKHNTLPCDGHVTVSGRRYPMEPERCHAVQDFGRGIWPYRSFWNWGVATGTLGGELIGINIGGRWTTGTGINENGVLLAGRLHKLMEDLDWRYDPRRPMAPWHVRTRHSDALDLTLRPRALHRTHLELGLLATGGFCAFGDWSGTVRIGGRSLTVASLVGWAEEFVHRW